MLQKHYQYQNSQVNNRNNIIYYYQVRINRINFGEKNIPNRVLSPIKRNNIINIK